VKVSLSRYFLFIFFLILIGVPTYWVITGQRAQAYSEVEARKLGYFPSVSFSDMKTAVKRIFQQQYDEAGELFFYQFLNKEYQESFSSAVTELFPLRLSGIQLTKMLERQQIALAYALLPDPAIPADARSGRYILRDGSLLFAAPYEFTPETIQAIETRIDDYAEMIRKYPDVHFYAYYLERIEGSDYYPLNRFFPYADAGKGFNYFSDHHPQGLVLGSLEFENITEYLQNNFHSDHHWNIYGALMAYDEIYQLVRKNYPEISSPVEHTRVRQYPDIEFLGSHARVTLYPIHPDKFATPNVDLPPYTRFYKGKDIGPENNDDYLQGSFLNNKYRDHYLYYYGSAVFMVEYDFEVDTERNLLLIGDSYKTPIQALLASHYDHTYSFNLFRKGTIDFDDLIQSKSIDDVIFLGDADVIYASENWILNRQVETGE